MNLDQQQRKAVEEEWKQIRSAPDYSISNYGRIKRLVDSHNNRKAGFLLKLTPQKTTGYSQCILTTGGKRKVFSVHRLVLEVFISMAPTMAHQCNHIDGIKDNNFVGNLEWVLPIENIRHAFENNLACGLSGEKSNLSKLKIGEVWLIKRLLYYGVYQRIIAKMFKVNRATVSYIKTGKTWREVKYS